MLPTRCALGGSADNALARLVEIAAAVAQANASARDFTGLCLFDEEGVRHIERPARGAPHLLRLTNLLADTADLFPHADKVPLARLLPLAYAVLQDLYPDWLDLEINSWPMWLPVWSPQPWYTLPPRFGSNQSKWAWPFIQLARVFLARLHPRTLFGNFLGLLSPHAYRWRKQVAAALSVKCDLGPGGLALLLEDDRLCGRYIQRFLSLHQIPCPLPFYDAAANICSRLPPRSASWPELLMHAVLRRATMSCSCFSRIFWRPAPNSKWHCAVRVALSRHHQVIVVCPWPPGVDLPASQPTNVRPSSQDFKPDLQHFLSQANTMRFHQAFALVRRAFAKLGVAVVCAGRSGGRLDSRTHATPAQA